MSDAFAYVDAVSESKRDVVREDGLPVSGYSPYLTNRSLSYHADAVLYANDMNCMPWLDPMAQYDYYMNSLRPRRRRSRWHKVRGSEDEDLLSELYGLSRARAREALALLSDDVVMEMRKLLRGPEDV